MTDFFTHVFHQLFSVRTFNLWFYLRAENHVSNPYITRRKMWQPYFTSILMSYTFSDFPYFYLTITYNLS
jgi:hypothetical protein